MNRALARVRVQKMLGVASRPSLWRAARQGAFPAVEHARVPFRDDFRTVLDVGASRGQFASLAMYRWPEAELICFEPLEPARAVLRRLVARHGATVHATALAAAAGEQTFHVSAADDSSSLLALTRRQTDEYPGTHAVSTVTVPVATLSAFLSPKMRRPALLKIDVQGAELDVLRGAGPSIQFIDEIFVEASFVELYEDQPLADEIICHLNDNGFRLVGVFHVSFGSDGSCLQGDLLFRRLPS